MSLIVTGDIHGTLDIGKVQLFFYEHDAFGKDDYLVICGDVGVCGFSASEEMQTRRILRDLPVTTLFIDGNHENFEQLNSYGIDTWNGGKVHFIENDIIHLMRGQVYDIDGIRIFTFGGAVSIDKAYRVEGFDWFSDEVPNWEEYEEGMENLERCGFKVDYIFSHTGPSEVMAELGYGEWSEDETELRRYLQRVADWTSFKGWYFGHFHDDFDFEEFHCLMDRVILLG